MPFTISHAAYSYPLKRVAPSYLSTTGLVLGAMSPDLEYFVRLEPYRSIGHSVAGFFLQAIPLAILIAFIFHIIVKPRLAFFMPSVCSLDARLHAVWQKGQSNRLVTLRGTIIFFISLAIGFASHIFIDEFTHAHGRFVQLIPSLGQIGFLALPWYKWLQYGLSIMGLLIIAITFIRVLWKSSPINMPALSSCNKLLFWLVSVGIAVVVTILKLLLAASGNYIGIVVVAPITGLCLGITISCLAWSKKLNQISS